MILDNITNSLSVKTAVAPATTDLQYSVIYVDEDPTIFEKRITVEGTITEVATDIVPAPTENKVTDAANIKKLVSASIVNNDTISHVITVNIASTLGLLPVNVFSSQLLAGEKIMFSEQEGWQVYDANGLKKNDNISESKNFATRMDKIGGTPITYIGQALPGSLTSDPVWMIRKMDETGGDLVIQFADGNDKYDNIWDNRLLLSYS